jgi:hypothetical protein
MSQPKIQESDQEKAARVAAEEEATGKASERSGKETDRLFRLFGARSSLGMDSPLGFSPMGK